MMTFGTSLERSCMGVTSQMIGTGVSVSPTQKNLSSLKCWRENSYWRLDFPFQETWTTMVIIRQSCVYSTCPDLCWSSQRYKKAIQGFRALGRIGSFFFIIMLFDCKMTVGHVLVQFVQGQKKQQQLCCCFSSLRRPSENF